MAMTLSDAELADLQAAERAAHFEHPLIYPDEEDKEETSMSSDIEAMNQSYKKKLNMLTNPEKNGKISAVTFMPVKQGKGFVNIGEVRKSPKNDINIGE